MGERTTKKMEEALLRRFFMNFLWMVPLVLLIAYCR